MVGIFCLVEQHLVIGKQLQKGYLQFFTAITLFFIETSAKNAHNRGEMSIGIFPKYLFLNFQSAKLAASCGDNSATCSAPDFQAGTTKQPVRMVMLSLNPIFRPPFPSGNRSLPTHDSSFQKKGRDRHSQKGDTRERNLERGRYLDVVYGELL